MPRVVVILGHLHNEIQFFKEVQSGRHRFFAPVLTIQRLRISSNYSIWLTPVVDAGHHYLY